MHPDLQTKLLRMIQERTYFPVGGNTRRKVDARIICASNRDLGALVEKGIFRSDLFYRINVCGIHIPPLRKRKEEILPLTAFFINDLNRRTGRPVEALTSEAVRKLQDYHWPGNIRELKNCITKSFIFQEEPVLREEDILLDNPDRVSAGKTVRQSIEDFTLPDTPFSLDRLIDSIVRKALQKNGGNKSRTARYLGLSRIQLYRHYRLDDVSDDT